MILDDVYAAALLGGLGLALMTAVSARLRLPRLRLFPRLGRLRLPRLRLLSRLGRLRPRLGLRALRPLRLLPGLRSVQRLAKATAGRPGQGASLPPRLLLMLASLLATMFGASGLAARQV